MATDVKNQRSVQKFVSLFTENHDIALLPPYHQVFGFLRESAEKPISNLGALSVRKKMGVLQEIIRYV